MRAPDSTSGRRERGGPGLARRAGSATVCVLVALLSVGGVALATSPSRGQRGRRGPAGPQGPVGPTKAPDQFLVSSSSVSIAPGAASDATAVCPSGVASGGGGSFAPAAQSAQLVQSAPSGTGWVARGYNGTASAATFTAYAICDPSAGLFTSVRRHAQVAHAASAGTRGPRGRRGPQGPEGPTGQAPPQPVVRSTTVTIAPGAVGQATVACGAAAAGGGAFLASPLSTSDQLLASGPSSTTSGASTPGWSAAAFNSSSSSRQLTVYALCDPPVSSHARISHTTRGPRGPRGARGRQGPPGPPLVTQIEDVAATATVAAGATGAATATCDNGTVSGGGGFLDASASPAYGLLQSNPVSTGDGQSASGWQAAGYNTTAGPITLTVFAVCIAYVPAD